MKKLFFSTFSACILAKTAFSQTSVNPVTKDSATINQKFYFPVVYYTDSIALYKAMPKLAEQVLTAYNDTDKRTYFENTINYYLLAENYKKAIDMVDSVQKIDEDKSYEIEIKSYALAKISEKKKEGSFEKVFKKEFADAFGQLSFRKKVYASSMDTSWTSYFKSDYNKLMEKLRKNNKDSLTLEDLRSVCDKFNAYTVYKTIIPIMSPLVDPQYKAIFPAIKGTSWAGALPVRGLEDLIDSTMQYKLLFELTGFAYKGQDSTAKKEINAGLGAVARELNLHEAAGVPKKNIDPVIVAHGGAVDVFLTNKNYKKRYGIDNPNIALIKELQGYGVKIIVCGQLLTYSKLESEDLVPGIKTAFSAQTVLSTYQLKNYVHYDLSLTE